METTESFHAISCFGASILAAYVYKNFYTATVHGSANSALDKNKRKSRQQQVDLEFYNTLRNCDDFYISKHINDALNTLLDSMRLYGPDRVISSYNGGKDADVVMHLIRAAAAKFAEDSNRPIRSKCLYFVVPDEFPEILEHIEKTRSLYNLDVQEYTCGIPEGIKLHIESMNAGIPTRIKSAPAFILGTRLGDPHVHNQQTFAPSSNWMPVSFMRINPILAWEYGHVWHFLRTFDLPYCSLYDKGYTSLGKRSQTQPNLALRRKSELLPGAAQTTGIPVSNQYWPAYMLSDWSMERAGREASLPPSPSLSPPQAERIVRLRVAMIIIGDEILNGFATEMNLRFAAQSLNSVGAVLEKAVIVGDDEHDIAKEVRLLSQGYDIVITSGGIGPTHDDRTLKGVAAALQQRISVQYDMLRYLESVQEQDRRMDMEGFGAKVRVDSVSKQQEASIVPVVSLSEDLRRLALLPERCQLRFPPPPDDVSQVTRTRTRSRSRTASEELMTGTALPTTESQASPSLVNDSTSDTFLHKTWPILQCDNIFILPGVPQYFSSKMTLITKYFLPLAPLQFKTKVVLDLDESALVNVLDCLVAHHKLVKFGSYPFLNHPEFKTILSLTSGDILCLEAALAELLTTMPKNAVLRVEKDSP